MTGAVTMLTVPGNLLLLGEYAVLEEGGLGIAVAVERRVLVELRPAPELTIVGTGGGFSGEWRRTDESGPSLIGEVVAATDRELAVRGLAGWAAERELGALGLRIDSSALFGPDGRKLGLGSSAAVAVGIAQALLRSAGLGGEALAASSFRAALAGHRAKQGGIGSGYDVAASLHGGYGLFTGGESPSFAPLALAWMRPFSLVQGESSVDTPRAIGRYMQWKSRSPAAAQDFLRASNENVRGFAEARDWKEASSRLREGARLGIELGEAIGVSARMDRLEGREGKALGAGDELGALWGEDEAVQTAATGPIWSA